MTTSPAVMPSSRLSVALPALAFGALIYLTLPSVVVVLNDDFGYLRSVVETLQHGRPWTDDWLEPWSASFSLLSATLYLLSGSFHFATYGLLAILAAMSFLASCLLWRARDFSNPVAILPALLILTFPTIFWKEMEFTGVALHVPCLLFAVWLAETKQWRSFLIVWLIAIANRQSALAWLAIPGLEILQGVSTGSLRRQRAWLSPLLLSAAGVAFFVLVALVMNKTHAQLLITNHSLDQFDRAQAQRALLVGAAVFLIAAGIGNFLPLVRVRRGGATWSRWCWLRILIPIAGARLLFVDCRSFILFEHPGFFGPYGLIDARAVLGIALVGWLAPRFRLDFRKAIYALAGLGLVALRHDLWDYYLVDVAIFGLFSAGPVADIRTNQESPRPLLSKLWMGLGLIPLAMILALQLRIIYELKLVLIDRGAALCQLTEEALRKGELQVVEIGHTNIGFMGWYWHPYFITHEGKADPNLVGFVRYIKFGSVNRSFSPPEISEDSPQLRAAPNMQSPGFVDSKVFRVAWIFHQRYTLTRPPQTPPAQTTAVDLAQYRPTPFPLNDREWSRLIASPSESLHK
jgi:hypothetical protein